MKKQLITTFSVMLVALNGISQNPKSGIYKTYADYNNNKLAYEIDCKTEKHVIRLNEFLNESWITVKHKGEKIKLQKDSIYAVLTCDEPLIRFQNKEHFHLTEKGAIWIFYKEINTSEGKGIKTVQLEKEYYFSVKGDSKIISLTISNIKYAFPNNHKLHDMLDAEIKSEKDISTYDAFHKMFKINHIITSSNNNTACPAHPEITGKEGDKCSKCGMSLENK